jgi:uncharacterized repeat protein (TIGR03803 family)
MYSLNVFGPFQARVVCAFAALALLFGARRAPAAGQVWRLIEDFQGLPANTQSAPIDGFKQWEEVGSSIDFRVRRGYMDDTPTGNQNFALVGEGTAIGPAHFPEHSKAGFFIDVPVGNSGSRPFVIVAPATGSADDHDAGPSFGVIDGGFFGSGTFFITAAGGGESVISTNGGSLCVMRLVIDPFAFSGDGAGYFFFAPLSPGQYRGDLAFYPVPDLQGIPLGLRRPGVPAASSWDKIMVTLGEFNAVDNIATGRTPAARFVGFEVNQSVQDMEQSIPLIANKRTQARAYLEAGEAEDAGESVTGRLRLFSETSEGEVEYIESPLPPISHLPFTVPAQLAEDVFVARSNYNWASTLNFALPSIGSSNALKILLEVDDLVLLHGRKGESGPRPEGRAVFQDVPRPKVAIARVRVRTTADGPLRAAPPLDIVKKRLARAIQQYPVDQFELRWVPPIQVRARVPIQDDAPLLNALERRRRNGTFHFTEKLIGAVEERDLGRGAGLGSAMRDGSYAWASMDRDSTLAHELGHLLHRPHPASQGLFGTTNLSNGDVAALGPCGATTRDLSETFPFLFHVPPLGIRPTLGPMFTGERSRVFGLHFQPGSSPPQAPDTIFELMGYCTDNGERWISKHTYTRLRQHITSLYSEDPGAFAAQALVAVPNPSDHLIVRGMVDLNASTVTWLPFHKQRVAVPPVEPPGAYKLEMLNAAQVVIAEATFNLQVAESETETRGHFDVTFPASANYRAVRLLRNGVVLGQRAASANPPVIQLVAPAPGLVVNGPELAVRWLANDADGDTLHFTVEYSRDNGASWDAVALDLDGDSGVDLDAQELFGSAQARIGVLASDGFHCVSDELDGPITVPDKGPEIAITSPGNDEQFSFFEPVTFEAFAIDMEEGGLEGASLVWRSDRDGMLGNGERLFQSAWQLSEGLHEITLTATDSAGHSSVATNRIRVERFTKPKLTILRGTNAGATIRIAGTRPSRSTIEVSSNLVDWVVWREMVHSNLTVEAIDNFAERGRFYRVSAGPLPTVINAQPFDRGGFVGFESPVSIDVTGQWLGFQWFFNGTAIPGATNSTFVIRDSQTTNNGPYFVVVSNMTGVITSAVSQVTIVSNNWSTLHRFGSGGLDGTNGWGPLAYGGDGMLYGCARNGGISNAGAIYRIGLNGSNYSVLRFFQNDTDGAVPLGGVIMGSDGRLYGTCSLGGTNNAGTVWRMNRDGSGFEVLRHLLSFGDCRNPNSELLEGSDGMLYGTAQNGGGFGNGGVFRLQKDGSSYATIKGFRTTGGDGKGPIGGLIEGLDGHLYGTTEFGGLTTNGIVFRLSKDGTNYTILKHMGLVETGTKNPRATLLLASDGFLYGTTVNGGLSGFGTVFKLRPNGEDFNVIYNFGDAAFDPQGPTTKLIEAPTGLLFGTSRIGGAGQGTIYRMRKDGSIVTALKSLGGVDGARSQSALLMVGGFLYSSTFGGGVNEAGTIFRYWHWNLADKIVE